MARLLAIGAALLFGRQWSSSTESTLNKAEPVTKQSVEPTVDRAELPPVAAATLAGSELTISGLGGKRFVVEKWDGQALELKL